MHLLGFIVIIIVVFFLLLVEFMPIKENRFAARKMPAIDRMRRHIELSVEDGSQLIVGVGNGSLIDENSVATLSGQLTAKRVLKTTAFNDVAPVLSSGDGTAFLINQDLISNHTNYKNDEIAKMNRLDGVTPMSYALGFASTVRDENVTFCIVEGNYGEEIVLVTDSVLEKDTNAFVSTNNLIGQAVAVPFEDDMMIGEEFFIVNTYLGSPKDRLKEVLVHDALRAVVVVAIVIATLANIVGGIL